MRRSPIRSSAVRTVLGALLVGGVLLVTAVSMRGGLEFLDRFFAPEAESSANKGPAAPPRDATPRTRMPGERSTGGADGAPALRVGDASVTLADAAIDRGSRAVEHVENAATAPPDERAAGTATPRDYVRIVSAADASSYSQALVEQWRSRSGEATAPVVDVASRSEALALFCAGAGPAHPDILAVFGRMRAVELETCVQNDVREIVDLKVGYEMAILARSVLYGPMLALSPADVFLALAEQVLDPAEPESLVENPYRTWNEIEPSLAPDPIRVIGATSGSIYVTGAGLAALMDAGCDAFPALAALTGSDERRYLQLCRTVRRDGVYAETVYGETPDIITSLQTYPTVVGVFNSHYFLVARDELLAIPLDGVAPTPETIASGAYPAARALHIYVKKPHVKFVPSLVAVVDVYRGNAKAFGLMLPDEEERRPFGAAALGPSYSR